MESYDVDREEVVDYTAIIPGSYHRRYEPILTEAYKLLQDQFPDYIWYRESFNFSHFAFGEKNPCLFGSTDFGGCVEDEWVIVWILQQLTKKFSELFVRVSDSDGEFLLIEAANVLPSWLTPDIADNRIWIKQGKLAIIPEHAFKGKSPSLEEAFEYLKWNSQHMIYDPKIDQEAFSATERYPNEAREFNCHRAKVTVPTKVAVLLHRFPFYISAALECFWNRDGSDPRTHQVLSEMKVFPPDDLVETVVRFTRRQYAQITPVKYTPPWDLFDIQNDNNDHHQLGQKLACGMELLAHESLRLKPRTKETTVKEFDFQDILADMHERYFAGYEKGTKAYEEMTTMAIRPYMEARRLANENAYLPIRIRQQSPPRSEIGSWDKSVDSEQWLTGDAASTSEKKDGTAQEQDGAEDEITQDEVQEILTKLNEFMSDEKAGLAGIDNNNTDNDENGSSSSDDSTSDEDEDEEQVKVDLDDFMEYFMTQELKLPPEELEKYRARQANDDEGSDNDQQDGYDAEAWDQAQQELEEEGIALNSANSEKEMDILLNLTKSLSTAAGGGAETGPSATLLRQLGVDNATIEKLARKQE